MNGHECYIIGAGDFFGLLDPPDDSDYVIAADAGYLYCRENNIIPDLVIGDFDSLGQKPEHPYVLELPEEKDDTDTLFAIKTGMEKGYKRFYLYGCLGGKRPEHSLANMQSLLYLALRGRRGWMFGKNEVWTCIHNGRIGLKGKGNVSVFCPDGRAEGVLLKGLKYELYDAVLSSDVPLGVSNYLDGEAEIEVKSGSLIIIYESDIGEKD